MKLLMFRDTFPCIQVYNKNPAAIAYIFREFNRTLLTLDYDLVCFGARRNANTQCWQPRSSKKILRHLSLNHNLWYYSLDRPNYVRDFDPAIDSIIPYISIFKDIVDGSKDCHMPD